MWAIEQHATGDFETYSEAGQVWDGTAWRAPPGAQKKGISAVGAAAYAEHPSTVVLTFSYRLPHWPAGMVLRWRPGQPNPQALFDHLAAGGLMECHNVMFERLIWWHVCRRLYGWPELPAAQLRCSMAKARVNNLPGALGNLTDVLPVPVRKDADGKRLLDKFSVPRKPTKKDTRLRILPEEEPEEAERLYSYCDDDVLAEVGVSDHMMPMSRAELAFWQIDQAINWRGIGVDMDAVRNMIAVLEAAQVHYAGEMRTLTGGLEPTQVAALRGWLAGRGVHLESLDAEAIDEALGREDLPAECRRVLEVRALVGSASVKKLYAIARTASSDNRVRNIIVHHGARTGRPTGDLVQPLNLPKAGPDMVWCESCDKPSRYPIRPACPWCAASLIGLKRYKWPDVPKRLEGHLPVEDVLPIMATRSLPVVEHFFGSALLTISGCVRSMFVAGPGMELLASDYSAIEAVVTAVLAGCRWRIETFERGEDIYLVSAGKITGRTMDEYAAYFAANNSKHPDRQKIGKVSELGLGFGGWLPAWRMFDSTANFTDDEVKRNILAWRDASPEIVEMWGGQARGLPWKGDYRLERFGFEGAFVNAIQYPDMTFESHGISFYMRGDCLIIRLLSGRELPYHSPRLWPGTNTMRPDTLDITYMTWNSNSKYGAYGWVPMKTYAGRIAENIVQATAHDIQRYGITALEARGYPVVLHVYDENVSEVPAGWGSIEEYESIMAEMPPWAQGWPIRASGGWRGHRYRKA